MKPQESAAQTFCEDFQTKPRQQEGPVLENYPTHRYEILRENSTLEALPGLATDALDGAHQSMEEALNAARNLLIDTIQSDALTAAANQEQYEKNLKADNHQAAARRQREQTYYRVFCED